MSIINAIIMGLIQGAAEFLPISGSGHLAIAQNLFRLTAADEVHSFFNFLLHLSALLAVVLVYKEELVKLYNDCVTFFTSSDKKLKEKSRGGARQVLMMAFTTLPLVLLVPFYGRIHALSSSTLFVAMMLLLTGCLLYVADQFLPGKKNGNTITLLDALIIGVCQCVSVLPGMSRTATTIAAGLCCGVDKEFAVKYSFLIAIPSMLGGTILSFVRMFGYGFDIRYVPAYLIGTAVALVSGVLSVGLLQLIVKSDRFGKFCYYCWGAGVIAVILTALL